MGHGITNSQLISSLPSAAEERDVIQYALETIERTTGHRPKGWLGPALAESYDTLDLLAEQGIQYVADWNSDDQPYRMKVKRGKMLSIPYWMELSDTRMFARHGYTGAEYFDAIVDQFETLYSESERIPRVMGIPLHPFLVGQPLRIKYLEKAITHMRTRERVWFATGAEIAEAFENLGD